MVPRVNYLYFGAFFALLVVLCASSIFTKESLGASPLFFFLYTLGQIAIEVGLLIFMTLILTEFAGKVAKALFIGATFVILFLHIFDFLMDRILDFSTWEALNVFVFQENLSNFFYLLDASGISLWIWFLLFAILAALPFIGMFIYSMTDKIASKRPLKIPNSYFLQVFLCIPLALLLWEFTASKVIHPDAYHAFRKSLPWKFTFLQPQNTLLSLPGPLKMPIQEEIVFKELKRYASSPQKKPNIYLFIAESLRADSITAKIAPNLNYFKNNFIHFDQAIAGGNGTQISWFSIFHSQFPYHWKHMQQNWKMGSPALKLLKQWGYQIRLYSSAQLSYYGMETLLFGKNASLLDSKKTFHHAPPASAADTDAAALAQLQKDLEEHPDWKEGQIFILFWDCTHFDYSWPKTWIPKFSPFAQEFAYFRTILSEKTISAIKNRYFNAVNYLDHLFGKFLERLPNDAIVIFTGDHGEEFFDHGHLFHNSHLTQEQIAVPLYCKFGDGNQKTVSRPLISQMDIFPSIIDYLGEPVPHFFEGNSLFQKPKLPFAITARFNAGCTPYEFSIHNGKNKLIAQFDNRSRIFESKKLKLISLRGNDDKSIRTDNVEGWTRAEFKAALNHLFIRGVNNTQPEAD